MDFFWLLVLAFSLLADAASPKLPSTLEFDLVFPRNETYAPTTPMPLVFAIQNPELLKPLLLSLSYSVHDTSNYNNVPFQEIETYRWDNFSSNPHYVLYFTDELKDREGTFEVRWRLYSTNCSIQQDEFTESNHFISSTQLVFTTKKGGQQPDIRTPPGACDRSLLPDGVTFNVTGLIERSGPGRTIQPICAVISPTPPIPDPCRAGVGDEAAASMSARITDHLCLWPDPVVSCPPKSAGQRGVQGPGSGTAWVAVALGGVLLVV